MSVQSRICFRYVAVMVLLAVVLPQSGCNLSFEQDPATTVTVEITGVDNDSDRESIQETLKGMADGSSHMMTSSSFGDTMTVNLSPVEDVEAFSKKIDFGKVTEVNDRTVKVDFAK